MQDLMVKAGVNLDPGRNLLDPKTAHPDTMDAQKRADRTQMKKGDVAGGQADEARFEEGINEGEGALCEDCGGMHEGACMEENLQEEETTEEEAAKKKAAKKKAAKERVKEKIPWLNPESPDYAGMPKTNESLQEGWNNKKDQLLFERLVDKWIK